MNWPWTRTPSNAGKELAEHRCLTERERIRARARLMREELGLPAAKALGLPRKG